MLLRPALPPGELHLVTSALALAACDAVAGTAGVQATLKWPNDLLVGEAKLAGILAEVVGASTVARPTSPEARSSEGPGLALVVGIGINLEWPVGFLESAQGAELRASATTLAQEGTNPGREVLLEAFLAALEVRYRSLSTAAGRAGTLAAYRSACSTLGREVRVIQAGGDWTGVAESLTDDGRLAVRRGTELVSLDAADVLHLRTAPPPPRAH